MERQTQTTHLFFSDLEFGTFRYFGRVFLQECLLRNTEPYDLRGFCRIILPSKQGEANYFGNEQAEAGKGLEKELPLLGSGIFSRNLQQDLLNGPRKNLSI